MGESCKRLLPNLEVSRLRFSTDYNKGSHTNRQHSETPSDPFRSSQLHRGKQVQNRCANDIQTTSSVHDRSQRVIAKPVLHTQTPPTCLVERSIRQLVCLLIIISRNAPEACPDTHHSEIVAQMIEPAEEPLVLEMVTTRVEVPILTPLDDPRSHAVD